MKVIWETEDIRPGRVAIREKDGTRLTMVEQTTRGLYWGFMTEDWLVGIDFSKLEMAEHLNLYGYIPAELLDVLAR